jgi:hypothetical protein
MKTTPHDEIWIHVIGFVLANKIITNDHFQESGTPANSRHKLSDCPVSKNRRQILQGFREREPCSKSLGPPRARALICRALKFVAFARRIVRFRRRTERRLGFVPIVSVFYRKASRDCLLQVRST